MVKKSKWDGEINGEGKYDRTRGLIPNCGGRRWQLGRSTASRSDWMSCCALRYCAAIQQTTQLASMPWLRRRAQRKGRIWDLGTSTSLRLASGK
jgi:hypothetical protein